MTLSSANGEISRKAHEAQLRQAARLRIDGLIGVIDQMFWELEDLNLRQVRRLPVEVRGRVATVLAEATGRAADSLPRRHKTTLALDVLFDTQERLMVLRSMLTPGRPEAGSDSRSPLIVEELEGDDEIAAEARE